MNRKTKTEGPENQGNKLQIPYYEKYLLSIDEAAVYFHIGSRKMQQLVQTNPKARWWLINGNRKMIKKAMFADWLDQQTEI